jgi:two-component system phosphate regulon sensor histidine kinase PhoR
MNSDLLEQAIVNLIDNAIKFSPENSRVDILAANSDHRLVITVTDQGVGIEKKHLPRLFERFYRVDKARSRNLGGTGLGLAIVKHIAQVHGGNVRVESKPGIGSTFSIYIPIT